MNKLNIYHFDLKSSNILYKDNNIKIIDFGEIGISNKNPIVSVKKPGMKSIIPLMRTRGIDNSSSTLI